MRLHLLSTILISYLLYINTFIHGFGIKSSRKESPMRYHTTLDTENIFQLYWDIEPALERITFHLAAEIQKDQILGFGFSDYGESTNADFVVLWKDIYGKRHFQDMHTDNGGLLHVDHKQDYILDAAEVTMDTTNVTFHRLYDTCDDEDYVIDSGTTHILYFVVDGPLWTVRNLNVTAMEPGLQRVQLLKTQIPDPEQPDSTWDFLVHVDKVEIPDVETTYWCQVKKLPPIHSKHHIIQFDGAITQSSQGIVHHLEVFHCEVPPGAHVREYNKPCEDKENRPMGLEQCRKVIGAWAMGAKGLVYPEEAGYPVGGEGFSRYVMLEIHYNNPTRKKGVIDSSGIRFHVTPELREHDAGVMELGLQYVDKYALPPGLQQWELDGYCIPKCTQTALPPRGINVFASQLHTHLTGKQVYTKHYRNGIELLELNRDNHYSPHYQEIRTLGRPVRVMPGDALITTCVDSTLGMTNVTLGGFSISDEMCVNYIHYYPKVELEICKSSATDSSVYGFFKFLNEYQGEPTSPKLGISDNYKSIRWTPMNVQLLATFYDNAPLSMQCNQSSGFRFPGNWEELPIPQVLQPLPPTERPCLQ